MKAILNLKNSMFNKIKLVVFLMFLVFVFSTFFETHNIFAENINTDDIKINSRAAILIDSETNDILYSKNSESKVYPASTTKILTAILAIEKLDLNSTTIVSKSAIIVPPGSSSVNLKIGEILTIKDLLYCLLLRSGNDSANVLAEAVSTTIPDFIILMNKKTKELGLTKTNFTNSHGYHNNNHYTTATDMIKLLQYALENETFKSILTTKKYTIPPTNKTTKERSLQTTNSLLLNKDDSYLADYYNYCLGGKTGFTNEAGKTFIAFGKKENRNVLLGTFDVMDLNYKDLRNIDAKNLFEYGFNNFENKNVLEKNSFKFEYIDKNTNTKYLLGIKDNVYFTVKKTDDNKLNSPFNIIITNNIDNGLLSNYTYNTTATGSCQVVGNININFNTSLESHYKKIPLIVLKKEKIGLTLFIKNAKLIVFKLVLCLFVLFLVLLFLIIVLLIKKTVIKSKKKYIYNIPETKSHKQKELSKRRPNIKKRR